MDHEWRKMQERKPDDNSRETYAFILTAAARGWHPETLPAVIDLVEEMHERDPANKGYGNYRWYRKNEHPDDFNAVQFCMQTASLTWLLYRDQLVPDARTKLEAAIRLASEGVRNQVVKVDYTNIFLMRLSNAILIGQATNQPALVAQGKAWFTEWFAYTRAHGIHEFSSPTYYGVDLDDLGSLSRYAADPEVRAEANQALQFLWTDIAANWFEPYQGISGAYSRDYGFLTGHGYLDQHLLRAGWLPAPVDGESRPVLNDLAHVDPPANARSRWGDGPRIVAQQYGLNPTQRADHYVGRHFSLGSAGEMYGAQDRLLALTFDGGPKEPIVSFSLEYRDDPYGQSKVASSGGHDKLTHLMPLVGTVQDHAEVLQVLSLDPMHARNPAGGSAPIVYAGVWATVVLPAQVQVWQRDHLAPPGAEIPLDPADTIFLRSGTTAAAIRFVYAQGEDGQPAEISLFRDGAKFGAWRLSALLSPGKPKRTVVAALWVRAAEGLDDQQFARFRFDFNQASLEAHAAVKQHQLTVSVPGMMGQMAVTQDLEKRKTTAATGFDPAALKGILTVDGVEQAL